MRVTSDMVVRAARRFERVPYRHLGRSLLGVDCIGLFICAAWDLGLMPRTRDWRSYTTNVADYQLEGEMEASGMFTRLPHWREARVGDAILQKFHTRLPASHVLLVTKFDGTYWWAQHASLHSQRVITQRLAHTERNFAAFRLKGVAESG